MTRGPLDHSVTLLLDAEEHDFFDAMKSAVGIAVDANLLRAALVQYAKFIDVPIGSQTFKLRSHADTQAARQAQRRAD